ADVALEASPSIASTSGLQSYELSHLDSFDSVPSIQGGWSAMQATGKPDTKDAGDSQTAWASLREDEGEEWLDLGYAQELKAIEIQVFENFNPGALCRVCVFDKSGDEVEVWKGDDPTPTTTTKGVSSIAITAPFKTDRVRLYLDSKRVKGWNEIDAVALRDRDGQLHWATTADASSCYGEDREAQILRRLDRLTNEVRQLKKNQESLMKRRRQ
ncbi:MAG: hypothetical protein K2Z81_03715, partial [Cyanobacteria bacterium]|nr:hypothetical protein [Cyanobacteriota bacterium]